MYTDSDRFLDIASAFVEAGYITAPGRVIKLGKEASVLCCPAHPSLGVESVALKIYKDQSFRNFRSDAVYLRGKVWKRRDLAHLHAFKDHLWVDTEFRVLERLHAAAHPVIIDFPQAVFADTHDDPYPLFRRDVERVVESIAPTGLAGGPVDGAEVARELWERHYLVDATGVP